MYVCICMAVTDGEVRAATKEGACTLEDLQHGLGVATGCGQCAGAVCDMLGGVQAANGQPMPGHDPGAASI